MIKKKGDIFDAIFGDRIEEEERRKAEKNAPTQQQIQADNERSRRRINAWLHRSAEADRKRYPYEED